MSVSDASPRYQLQSSIIRTALESSGHPLDVLLQLMRSSRESALYLSGTRLDNDYCFGSQELALLLSVLPEDAPKAAEPGYHPGSTEVYVTFQGSLELEYLQEGLLQRRTVGGHDDVLVISPGQCHRVCRNDPGAAASLIAKTNPGYKPGVIRCAECGYYADASLCPLNQSWTRERADDRDR